MTDLTTRLLDTVSGNEMWRHLERLVEWDRTSGTQGEFDAVDYIVRTLESYGLPVTVHEYRAFLSYPEHGALTVVHGDATSEIRAKTRAFSATTSAEGVSGPLVSIKGGTNMFKADDAVNQISPESVGGKIVLSESGSRGSMLAAQAAGALAYIHMWPSDEDVIHEGIVTPVWGTPTPESADRLPTIPIISIRHTDGLELRAALERGPAEGTVQSTTRTGWSTMRMPVTEIPGSDPEFVLVAGHLDSWHYGATDNATGNVACLEIARVLHEHRAELRRGARIAWWVGHSTGRYSGSTWYADHHWHDLDERCVAYVNIDSPGALGATDYSVVSAVPETAAVVSSSVEVVTGQVPEIERPMRAGDQSFWGVGVASLYMLLSSRPEGQRAAVGGCGMGWWWHAEEDLLDKADQSVLTADTKIYLHSVAQLLNDEVLPLDVLAQLREIRGFVEELDALAADRLDLTPVHGALGDLEAAFGDVSSLDAARRNAAIRTVNHRLTAVSFTSGDRFDHDPAFPLPPLPSLDGVRQLARLDPDTDAFGFLQTRLVRSRNAVVHHLKEAAQYCRTI
ncbi:MAG: M28 family peptidase [Gemmatimonadaceae bacterium]|nr:M28 family peptidase [Gemmatimonadaceae bacterium]